MLRNLVTEFPQERRCEKCDIILTASTFDNKPIAVRQTKVPNPKRKNANSKYECIRCATKETSKMKFSTEQIK